MRSRLLSSVIAEPPNRRCRRTPRPLTATVAVSPLIASNVTLMSSARAGRRRGDRDDAPHAGIGRDHLGDRAAQRLAGDGGRRRLGERAEAEEAEAGVERVAAAQRGEADREILGERVQAGHDVQVGAAGGAPQHDVAGDVVRARRVGAQPGAEQPAAPGRRRRASRGVSSSWRPHEAVSLVWPGSTVPAAEQGGSGLTTDTVALVSSTGSPPTVSCAVPVIVVASQSCGLPLVSLKMQPRVGAGRRAPPRSAPRPRRRRSASRAAEPGQRRATLVCAHVR